MAIDRKSKREVRDYYAKLILSQNDCLFDPHCFSTIDPNYLIRFAVENLRWIDCAPEGASFIVAPMMDKQGTPMGGKNNENLGPNQALRQARMNRNLHPISGKPIGMRARGEF